MKQNAVRKEQQRLLFDGEATDLKMHFLENPAKRGGSGGLYPRVVSKKTQPCVGGGLLYWSAIGYCG
jgi:hypothetical protein